ncbi:MAG: metal ABC transporter permease [Candidatus Nucleicultricaceae bacterium]
MTDLLLKALLGGICVSVIAGVLGVFIVWRRMSFFGDTVAHASLGGVALSLVFGIASFWGPFFSGFVIAFLMSVFKRRLLLSNDTWLAIVSQVTLALGLLSLSFFRSQGIQIQEFLFGDILALSTENITFLLCSVMVILVLVLMFWKPFLLITLSEELAAIHGVRVFLYETLFLTILASGVALCIKFFGILLLTALMIIPAASARQLASTPLKMMMVSMSIAMFSVVLGLWGSYTYDVPTSPVIVVTSALIFCGTLLMKSIKSR